MSFDPPGSVNPFEAPRAGIGEKALVGELADADAELVRRQHISREANVKSVGQLLYVGGFCAIIGTVVLFLIAAGVIPMNANPQAGMDSSTQKVFMAGLGVGCLALTVIYIGLGYGLTHLMTWARWTMVALVSLGLINNLASGVMMMMANPTVGIIATLAGSIIPGAILYILVSGKASVVFSKDYKEVVRKTPHIKQKTSIIVKVLLVVLLLVIALIVVAVLFAPRR